MTDQIEHDLKSDVAVIGGGTAGSAAAILLTRLGLSTVVIDAGQQAEWKIGESVPPSISPLLQTLGLWEDFQQSGHLSSDGNRSSWGDDQLHSHSFIFQPGSQGWHLNRTQFDQQIRKKAIQSGAWYLEPYTLLHSHRQSDEWEITLQGRNKVSQRLISKVVVDATGRSSAFARQQAVKRRYEDRLVGAVWLLSSEHHVLNHLQDACTWIEAVEDGWWYTVSVPSGQRVLAFMSDGDLEAIQTIKREEIGWETKLNQTQHIRKCVSDVAQFPVQALQMVSASSSTLETVSGDGWLAIGDAAATYDPLSSQGILMAIGTSIEASLAIRAFINGKGQALEHYSSFIETMYTDYLMQKAMYYTMEQRWSTSPFWRRRHVS